MGKTGCCSKNVQIHCMFPEGNSVDLVLSWSFNLPSRWRHVSLKNSICLCCFACVFQYLRRNKTKWKHAALFWQPLTNMENRPSRGIDHAHDTQKMQKMKHTWRMAAQDKSWCRTQQAKTTNIDRSILPSEEISNITKILEKTTGTRHVDRLHVLVAVGNAPVLQTDISPDVNEPCHTCEFVLFCFSVTPTQSNVQAHHPCSKPFALCPFLVPRTIMSGTHVLACIFILSKRAAESFGVLCLNEQRHSATNVCSRAHATVPTTLWSDSTPFKSSEKQNLLTSTRALHGVKLRSACMNWTPLDPHHWGLIILPTFSPLQSQSQKGQICSLLLQLCHRLLAHSLQMDSVLFALVGRLMHVQVLSTRNRSPTLSATTSKRREKTNI